MSGVAISAEGFVVDAEILGSAFDLAPATIPDRLKAGEITSRCEIGVDEDAGRWRLTFYRERQALRLTIDGAGSILAQSRFPISTR